MVGIPLMAAYAGENSVLLSDVLKKACGNAKAKCIWKSCHKPIFAFRCCDQVVSQLSEFTPGIYAVCCPVSRFAVVNNAFFISR